MCNHPHHPYPQLFASCKTETLYPLNNNSPFPHPQAPGIHYSALSLKSPFCVYQFFWTHNWVKSLSLSPTSATCCIRANWCGALHNAYVSLTIYIVIILSKANINVGNPYTFLSRTILTWGGINSTNQVFTSGNREETDSFSQTSWLHLMVQAWGWLLRMWKWIIQRRRWAGIWACKQMGGRKGCWCWCRPQRTCGQFFGGMMVGKEG